MEGSGDTSTESPLNLKDFKLTEILFNNASKKLIALLGKFSASDDNGIVLVEKVEFAEESFTAENDEDSIIKHTELEKVTSNDIYLNCMGLADQKFNSEFFSLCFSPSFYFE